VTYNTQVVDGKALAAKGLSLSVRLRTDARKLWDVSAEARIAPSCLLRRIVHQLVSART
jgi:hypothetical protein